MLLPISQDTSMKSSRPSKASSHKYFSRLSKQLFSSPPPSAVTGPRNKLSQPTTTEPAQRLCSLKRKSNNYFATQARNLTSSPDPEASHSCHEGSDQTVPIGAMRQGNMGNRASTPVPLLDAGPVRPSDVGAAGPADDKGRTITTASEPINFVSGEIYSQQPELPMEMKRPLPPPKSRAVVREEGKRARDIVNLCDDAEDASPNAKKAKTKEDLDRPQPLRKSGGGVLGTLRAIAFWPGTDMSAIVDEKSPGKLGLGAGSGSTDASVSEVWSGEGGTANAMITSTTPERKKKKLFTTLGPNYVARGVDHQAAALNGDVVSGAVLQFHRENTDGLHFQSANPLWKSTATASQQVNGHSQKTFCDQSNSMFADEGYESFCRHGFADEDDWMPEDEDELMKRINSSLGHSSPFVQAGTAKVKKPVTPEQIYAEKQQARDVERSRRMREANLAAKGLKSIITASGVGVPQVYRKRSNVNTLAPARVAQEQKSKPNGGGGLSISFLEDMDQRTDDFDPQSAQRETWNDRGPRSQQQKDRVRPSNGEYTTMINGVGKSGRVTAPKDHNTKRRKAAIAHTALLDIAEKYVRNTSPGGSVKSTQGSFAPAKPSEKRAADSNLVGSKNGDVIQTGFIRPLERQLSGGEFGAEQTASASDAARRQSVVGGPKSKIKKRGELDVAQTVSKGDREEAHDKQLAVETRLLELRDAPAPGNISPAPETIPIFSQEESLLDQLVKKNEERVSLATELLELVRSSSSIAARATVGGSCNRRVPKRTTTNNSVRAKDRVETAEATLLRMGLSASTFKDWNNKKKYSWADREQEFQGKTKELKELLARHSTISSSTDRKLGKRSADNLKEAGPSTNLDDVSSAAWKTEKQPNNSVAAAEAILKDLGLSPSDTAGWSYQKKIAWAVGEAKIARKKRELEDLVAKEKEKENASSGSALSMEQVVSNRKLEKGSALAAAETSESEESEEEDGWQYAIRWQGIEQPKILTDAIPLNPTVAKDRLEPGESEGEDEQDETEELEAKSRSDPGSAPVAASTTTTTRYQNRQAPDEELARQMRRKHFDDWSDEEELVHEYVVKAETWGMTSFPADHTLILGRYIDVDKAEEMVRDFILRCKPAEVARDLEVRSVWSNGNFSQTMIRDGEAGCRAFVEPEIASARLYPGLTKKVARRKTYAVLFERTISRDRTGREGGVEEDITATTVDDMLVFTTKSLANWEAKRLYFGWFKEHLSKPQDKCWLRMQDEDLCKYAEELNEEGRLFGRKEHIRKGSATDRMEVWVKEIAPKGPRN